MHTGVDYVNSLHMKLNAIVYVLQSAAFHHIDFVYLQRTNLLWVFLILAEKSVFSKSTFFNFISIQFD